MNAWQTDAVLTAMERIVLQVVLDCIFAYDASCAGIWRAQSAWWTEDINQFAAMIFSMSAGLVSFVEAL
jgi:hypothetical protein